MRIFTYGIEDRRMDAVRWHFGKAEYLDTTSQYQDILALYADKVVINLDAAPSDAVNIIKEFEEETKEDETKYYYVTNDEIEDWCKELYLSMKEAICQVMKSLTEKEYEAMHLYGIQEYHYEFYRRDVGKRELLILSFGDNPIDAKTYFSYVEKYDTASVGWFNDIPTKTMCLREMFEYRTKLDDLPLVLRGIKMKLDQAVEPFEYAYFGE